MDYVTSASSNSLSATSWTVLLLVSILFGCTTPTGIIVCHDCSGVDDCAYLLVNQWTGKCHALKTGKCFIRKDPNGILYRGCADALNWPHQLDISYNGCRYQKYGEWSDTEVLWCFCDHSLCNVNISYIQYRYPLEGQVNQGQVQVTRQPVAGNNYGQSGVAPGQGQQSYNWYVVAGSGSGQIQQPQRPAGVPPLVYMLPPGAPPAGKELVPPPVVVPGRPGTSYGTNWEEVLRYLEQAQFSSAQPPVVARRSTRRPVTRATVTPYPTAPPGLPQPTLGDVPPPSGYWTVNPSRQQPSTTTPSLKPPVNGTGSGRQYTQEELLAILNYILSELGLTSINASAGSSGSQLVFDLPNDVLKYLQDNLPHGTNNIQSLPYPLYVILYLLSVTGFNITTFTTGRNTTGTPITAQTPATVMDVPQTPTPGTGVTLDNVCPTDFIKQPSFGSCYKVFTQRSEARRVAESRLHCKQLSRFAHLAVIETVEELTYLASLLRLEPAMLEGWQGWWTNGTYRAGINQFYWDDSRVIPNTDQFWGFQRPPFTDTCVWILQIPNYNYTLANYDCFTASGHICEINLPNT